MNAKQRANPEKVRAERVRANTRRQERHAVDPTRRKSEALKAKYGITYADKVAMLARQGNVCRCCGAREPGSKLGWHVEHDHKTKKIRGVVCLRCNTLIAALGDDEAGLWKSFRMFLRYLRTEAP